MDAILGLHRDQLADELSAPQLPPAVRYQLSAQLAAVLRQLAQLRAGRGGAAPWTTYSALLSRHLVWLRRADADKLRLEAAPLPPQQLPARRAQLAALSRRLTRGRRRLTELRRLAGAGSSGRPPPPLAALERRQANLSAGVATWANYVSYVAEFWRRRGEVTTEARAGLAAAETALEPASKHPQGPAGAGAGPAGAGAGEGRAAVAAGPAASER